MVRLSEARSDLEGFRPKSHGFIAVFIGGTSGIGAAAVQSFAKWGSGATAYIVGRSAASAAQCLATCRTLAPSSTFEYIEQDIMQLKDIDRVCSHISRAESKVDLLYMTPDIPTLSGRVETEEHIDRLMSLRYYGRMRFIHGLLPLLEQASAPRVVSVLGPKKFEYGLDLGDLGLKERYGNVTSFSHCSLMNTLCMEEYAARYPKVSFVHVYPGLVLTKNVISGPLPWAVRKLIQWVIYPLFYIFAQTHDESGDRMMFISLSAALPPRLIGENLSSTSPLLACTNAGAILVGSDDIVGSGNYCVDWKARRMNNSSNLKRLRAKGARERVWQHTMEVFATIAE